ncbi:hypothetical protein BDY19DRAFT_898814 [Irpex rosettiformis]|uniref:Uncharacterized protein n=1 Tax=Irpex rosettiformis TaxID=378272 RepID=A0ACB8TQC9_9APHY|nr:hypothetical protein BDY19DRAFT_898814 [Irpex rosettiformis]
MTTVFELSPRQGLSEFMWSDGAGLQHAQRALFSRRRLAKDRIHWAFSPDNDPRVSSLIRWIDAMANGLATVGLQKLLETGQRGALITNADYRANTSPGGPTQPAFDWITLSQAKLTCDRIFQESVVTYKPHLQVIVFVFLLSNSQNSMAVWRRKVTIPEGVRAAHRREIAHIMEVIPQDKTVFVDEYVPLICALPNPMTTPCSEHFHRNHRPQNHQKRSVVFGNDFSGLDARKNNFIPVCDVSVMYVSLIISWAWTFTALFVVLSFCFS